MGNDAIVLEAAACFATAHHPWLAPNKLAACSTEPTDSRSTDRERGVPVAADILCRLFGVPLSPIIAAAARSLRSVSVTTTALPLRSAER